MLDTAMAEETVNPVLPRMMMAGRRTASIPGVLRGNVTITLHTIQAVQVFEGRPWSKKRPGIPGLFMFAAHLENLATGSAADDPYADWFLVRIERRLNEIEAALQREQKALDEQRDAIFGITVGDAESIEPMVFELRLRSPHAFGAARLIGLFDRVAATLLTLSYVGLIDRQRLLKLVRRLLYETRRPFYISQYYRLTGVTRGDVRQQTAKAIQVAKDNHAEVPAAIVEGRLMPRFSMAPKKPKITPAQAIQPRGLVAAEMAVEPAS